MLVYQRVSGNDAPDCWASFLMLALAGYPFWLNSSFKRDCSTMKNLQVDILRNDQSVPRFYLDPAGATKLHLERKTTNHGGSTGVMLGAHLMAHLMGVLSSTHPYFSGCPKKPKLAHWGTVWIPHVSPAHLALHLLSQNGTLRLAAGAMTRGDFMGDFMGISWGFHGDFHGDLKGILWWAKMVTWLNMTFTRIWCGSQAGSPQKKVEKVAFQGSENKVLYHIVSQSILCLSKS